MKRVLCVFAMCVRENECACLRKIWRKIPIYQFLKSLSVFLCSCLKIRDDACKFVLLFWLCVCLCL